VGGVGESVSDTGGESVGDAGECVPEGVDDGVGERVGDVGEGDRGDESVYDIGE